MPARPSASRRCASAAARAWPWSSSASTKPGCSRQQYGRIATLTLPRMARRLRHRADVPHGRGGDAHRTSRAADAYPQRRRPALVALVHARRRNRTAVTRRVQDGQGLALPEAQALVPPVVQAAVGPEPGRPGDVHALFAVRRLERLGAFGAEELLG